MKSLLGKYFYPCLIGIILEVLILFVVLVQNFRSVNDLADSIYAFFSRNTVIQSIFGFLSDWSILISIIPVFTILLLFLTDIRKDRRNRALGRIHDWAQNAILLLADYRQRDNILQQSPALRYEGTKVLMDALKKHSVATPEDARVVGGRLKTETRKAIYTFNTIDEKISNNDDSAYDDLRTLQHDLAYVMMSTFEILQK